MITTNRNKIGQFQLKMKRDNILILATYKSDYDEDKKRKSIKPDNINLMIMGLKHGVEVNTQFFPIGIGCRNELRTYSEIERFKEELSVLVGMLKEYDVAFYDNFGFYASTFTEGNRKDKESISLDEKFMKAVNKVHSVKCTSMNNNIASVEVDLTVLSLEYSARNDENFIVHGTIDIGQEVDKQLDGFEAEEIDRVTYNALMAQKKVLGIPDTQEEAESMFQSVKHIIKEDLIKLGEYMSDLDFPY